MDGAVSNDLFALIQSRAEGIRKSNGYLTDLGKSVHRGFYALMLANTSTKYPAMAIHPAVETVDSTKGGDRVSAAITMEAVLVIADKVSMDEKAYDVVRNCLRDSRRAIFLARQQFLDIAKRDDMEIGPAEPVLSADSKFVLYAMAVRIKYSETYVP